MPDEQHPNPLDETRMPLWQHLDELRNCLMRSVIAVGIAFCFTYYFSETLVLFLEQPLLRFLPENDKHLYFTGIADKFIIYVQVSALAALGCVLPYVLYQIWTFVSPALFKHERRFVVPFVMFGTVTFIMGLAFGYYLVIPYGYEYLIGFGGSTDRPIITLTEYFSLTLKLLLAVGGIFEVPVLLVLLGKFGIVNAQFLKRNRRYAFLISAVVSAVATPSPDAFTMILVLVPLYALFELSIIGVGMVNKSQPMLHERQ